MERPETVRVGDGDWLTAGELVARYAEFLFTKAGAIYLAVLSIAAASFFAPTLGWVALWSGPGVVIGGHLLLLIVLGIAGAVGDGLAAWLNTRFFHLRPDRPLHRVLYFALTCIALPPAALVVTLGDMP